MNGLNPVQSAAARASRHATLSSTMSAWMARRVGFVAAAVAATSSVRRLICGADASVRSGAIRP
eukprot:953985-Prymnesium_polylepis.2